VTVVWDRSDSNVVMIFDGKNLHTYIYVQSSMKGVHLSKLGPITVTLDGEIHLDPDVYELGSGKLTDGRNDSLRHRYMLTQDLSH
jgi:hypothetical protein